MEVIMKNTKAKKAFIVTCVAPATLLFIIFMIIPTIKVFNMSLYKWGGFSNTKQFVGLQNFKLLMNDSNFFRSFQNTILLIPYFCGYFIEGKNCRAELLPNRILYS